VPSSTAPWVVAFVGVHGVIERGSCRYGRCGSAAATATGARGQHGGLDLRRWQSIGGDGLGRHRSPFSDGRAAQKNKGRPAHRNRNAWNGPSSGSGDFGSKGLRSPAEGENYRLTPI